MSDSGFERDIPPFGTDDETTLAKLLGEFPDAVTVIDGQGRIWWANRAAERLFSWSLRDAMGMSGLELVHPEDLESVLHSLVGVQGKEIGEPLEIRFSTATGWRLMELIGAPVPWLEDGAVLICARDLTERRRFEVAHNQDARFRALVQNSATLTLLVSPEGIVESVSGALTRLLGHDSELVKGQPLARIVSESDRPELDAAFECASRGASTVAPVTVTLDLLRQGGRGTVPFELAIVNLTDDPTVRGYVVSGHDVTPRAHAELELRKTLSLLTATLEATADGILVVDADGRIASFNRRFAEMWHLPTSILAKRDEATAIAFVRDQLIRPEAFVAKVDELYSDTEADSHDVLEFKDGRVFELLSKPQRVGDAVVGRVWSFRDVTERKRLEDQLSYQALHDSLTGLGNRALFQDRLQHAAARIERGHGRLAVLFLDVDNFKTINDWLGHSAGDAVLQTIAEGIVGCQRRADTAARIGGDEFGVLVEQIGHPGEAIKLAERILMATRPPLTLGANEVSATVSIGIAFDGPGISSDQLLCNADLAMYAAKARGGNRHAEFEGKMHVSDRVPVI